MTLREELQSLADKVRDELVSEEWLAEIETRLRTLAASAEPERDEADLEALAGEFDEAVEALETGRAPAFPLPERWIALFRRMAAAIRRHRCAAPPPTGALPEVLAQAKEAIQVAWGWWQRWRGPSSSAAANAFSDLVMPKLAAALSALDSYAPAPAQPEDLKAIIRDLWVFRKRVYDSGEYVSQEKVARFCGTIADRLQEFGLRALAPAPAAGTETVREVARLLRGGGGEDEPINLTYLADKLDAATSRGAPARPDAVAEVADAMRDMLRTGTITWSNARSAGQSTVGGPMLDLVRSWLSRLEDGGRAWGERIAGPNPLPDVGPDQIIEVDEHGEVSVPAPAERPGAAEEGACAWKDLTVSDVEVQARGGASYVHEKGSGAFLFPAPGRYSTPLEDCLRAFNNGALRVEREQGATTGAGGPVRPAPEGEAGEGGRLLADLVSRRDGLLATYGGGYRGAELEIFHHGIETVFNWLAGLLEKGRDQAAPWKPWPPAAPPPEPEGGREGVAEEEWTGDEWAPAQKRGCCMPDRCLCPHVDHDASECFDREMAEAQGEPAEDSCPEVAGLVEAIRKIVREEIAGADPLHDLLNVLRGLYLGAAPDFWRRLYAGLALPHSLSASATESSYDWTAAALGAVGIADELLAALAPSPGEPEKEKA